MNFIISRTSLWGDEKPCPGAKVVQATRVDWRSCKSLEEVKTRPWGEDWFASGTNYREEKGQVARDMERGDIWVIEISNLDELLKFRDNVNEDLIIQNSDYKEYPFGIEIYDGHRE